MPHRAGTIALKVLFVPSYCWNFTRPQMRLRVACFRTEPHIPGCQGSMYRKRLAFNLFNLYIIMVANRKHIGNHETSYNTGIGARVRTLIPVLSDERKNSVRCHSRIDKKIVNQRGVEPHRLTAYPSHANLGTKMTWGFRQRKLNLAKAKMPLKKDRQHHDATCLTLASSLYISWAGQPINQRASA